MSCRASRSGSLAPPCSASEREEGRQVRFDPVSNPAPQGVGRLFELDLHSQVPAASDLSRTGLRLRLFEDVQDPLAG
jgi:hypothetical protein